MKMENIKRKIKTKEINKKAKSNEVKNPQP